MTKNWRRALLPALLLLALPVIGLAQVGISISVNTPPPELPVYDQPPIPEEGYLWTPGYWAWSDDIEDYYWVPGTWVLAPQPGYLWTPGYWGSEGAVFLWHRGYWGPEVGFYGGVNYGYGYGGRGYEGGYWRDNRLYYNRSVTNISNTNITNVYNKTVINNVTVNRVSYNGGSGGVRAEPTSAELAAAHARHVPATSAQEQHVQLAHSNPALRASTNHGTPPIAATPRPGAFSGGDVVAAKHGGTMSVYHQGAPAERGAPAQYEAQPHPAPGRPAPAAPRAAPQQEQRATQSREVPAAPEQYRAPQPARPPAPEQSRAPQPARPPAPEQSRAPQPHPPEHPPEHDHDRS
jgi:hypothetical protein